MWTLVLTLYASSQPTIQYIPNIQDKVTCEVAGKEWAWKNYSLNSIASYLCIKQGEQR